MSTPQKKSKLQATQEVAQERVDAELVEEDYEAQPDEAIAEGNQQDWEVLNELGALAARTGMPFPAGISGTPSAMQNPQMSEEEQGMEMAPIVVGPPAYGSPNPLTSGSRLLPLSMHPLNPDFLPEDSEMAQEAAIAGDYGVGYTGTLVGTAALRGGPNPPPPPVPNPEEGSEEAAEGQEAPQEGQDTTQASEEPQQASEASY
jgi:hypothetical protein